MHVTTDTNTASTDRQKVGQTGRKTDTNTQTEVQSRRFMLSIVG